MCQNSTFDALRARAFCSCLTTRNYHKNKALSGFAMRQPWWLTTCSSQGIPTKYRGSFRLKGRMS